MKKEINFNFLIISLFLSISFLVNPVLSQKLEENQGIDEKVKIFLKNHNTNGEI
ncbi:MAG: hypothetical protein ACE5JB_00775 [bacterium]